MKWNETDTPRNPRRNMDSADNFKKKIKPEEVCDICNYTLDQCICEERS